MVEIVVVDELAIELPYRLHRILVDEAVQPFRFLDIACGDARATVDFPHRGCVLWPSSRHFDKALPT
jgi:hypothetical protein